jgi:hypothetical protein
MAHYYVLSNDNIKPLSIITGLTEDELEKTQKECERFGSVQAFWTTGRRWFGIRLSLEVIVDDDLDRIMQDVMEMHFE